jgi:hypothetical protein
MAGRGRFQTCPAPNWGGFGTRHYKTDIVDKSTQSTVYKVHFVHIVHNNQPHLTPKHRLHLYLDFAPSTHYYPLKF